MRRCGAGRHLAVRDERDAGLADVLQPDDHLGALAGEVVGDGVRDEALLEALEVEVAGVAQELGAVLFASDLDGVAFEDVQEVGEGLCGAIGDAWGEDGGRAQEGSLG